MADITLTLSQKLNISPFEIMSQDVDEVILILNYFVIKGETDKQENNEQTAIINNDNFWDF